MQKYVRVLLPTLSNRHKSTVVTEEVSQYTFSTDVYCMLIGINTLWYCYNNAVKSTLIAYGKYA